MNPTIAILGIGTIIAACLAFAIGGSFFYKITVKPAAAKPAILEHCIGKVTYLQFENAVVTKLKPDGKVWTCGGV